VLVSDEGERPVVWSLLHHVVGVDGLHVRVGSQLQSISVVQFFQ
jgi:hypothetical protein